MEINELQQLDRDIRKTLLNYTLARDILQEWANAPYNYEVLINKLFEYLEIERQISYHIEYKI